jgi:hypothetical protein
LYECTIRTGCDVAKAPRGCGGDARDARIAILFGRILLDAASAAGEGQAPRRSPSFSPAAVSKKLKLNVDALAVESFEPESAPRPCVAP